MKLGEYITMLRAGYTKAEIDAIVAAEAAEPEQPAPDPAAEPEQSATGVQPEPVSKTVPEWAVSLTSCVENLTKTIQQVNRDKLEQPPELEPLDRGAEALKNYLTGGGKSG